MTGGKLFIFHYKTEMYATYVNELSRNLIFACTNEHNASKLRNTLMTHKRKHFKWLNKYKTLHESTNSVLKLNEKVNINLVDHASRTEEPIDLFTDNNNFNISFLDLDKSLDNQVIEHLYKIHRSYIFVIHDFEYFDDRLLSLNGVVVCPMFNFDEFELHGDFQAYFEQML